jgi:Spx/MgsR family transcriptional regulator
MVDDWSRIWFPDPERLAKTAYFLDDYIQEIAAGENQHATIRRENAMSVDVYGIKNCNTMKKAFAWLAAHGVASVFHDYKKEGAAPAKLAVWADKVGWEKLVNRSGTTFRALPEADRQDLDRDKALRLMQEKPSLIRRPVIEAGETLLVGFDEAEFTRHLAG